MRRLRDYQVPVSQQLRFTQPFLLVSVHAKVKEVATELHKRMNGSVFETGTWLKKVVQGFYQYHAVQHNIQVLQDFRYLVYWHWRRVLTRRSHKAKCTWERMNEIIDRWIPKPRITHPNPLRRRGAVPG